MMDAQGKRDGQTIAGAKMRAAPDADARHAAASAAPATSAAYAASGTGACIERIIERRLDGGALSDADVLELLSADDELSLQELCVAARELRRRNFGDKVFLYGFVYFSTWCRNSCAFCYFRQQNDQPPRYRKSVEETVDIAGRLEESGVHLIDLTMGEDPYFLDDPETLPELVCKVHAAVHLPIMVSPGVVDPALLKRLAHAGADWYALYQETYDPVLFARLRLGQSAQARIDAKWQARTSGMLLEEGLMTGFGERPESVLRSLSAMRTMEAQQVRVMTFIPQRGTPLENERSVDFSNELRMIAVMRLLFPDRLIPASLDVDGLQGLQSRLNAGANVVTSLIPPTAGLAGVAHAYEDIADGARTVEGIADTLGRCQLEPATAAGYSRWVDARRRSAAARRRHAAAKREPLKAARAQSVPASGSELPAQPAPASGSELPTQPAPASGSELPALGSESSARSLVSALRMGRR